MEKSCIWLLEMIHIVYNQFMSLLHVSKFRNYQVWMGTGSKERIFDIEKNGLSIDFVDILSAVHTIRLRFLQLFYWYRKSKVLPNLMQRWKVLQCNLNTWRKWHQKQCSGRCIRGIVLQCLWFNRWNWYKLHSLYAVFKAEKSMKLFHLFFDMQSTRPGIHCSTRTRNKDLKRLQKFQICGLVMKEDLLKDSLSFTKSIF